MKTTNQSKTKERRTFMVLRKLCFIFLAILLPALVPSSALAQAAHPEMVVSTEWLAAHLNDPKVVVLHVANKRSEYDAGHIPGARFLDTNDFIDKNSPLSTELPSAERLKDVFEKLGISENTRIIIYTAAWYPAAGRAYFTLDCMGHGNHAALLDGSIQPCPSHNPPLSPAPLPPAPP